MLFLKITNCLSKTLNLYVVRYASNIKAKPLRTQKPKSEIERKNHFVDYQVIRAIGGNGGDGCIAFLQLWKNPNAGPCGGNGGNGGHVVLRANSSIKSLAGLQTVIRAEDGERGKGKDMDGAAGEDSVVSVPLGTVVRVEENVVATLDQNEDEFIAARGGAGGHGNHFFLSNKNRRPEIAEYGGKGEEKNYILEMKIMAHAGLVGFPNAGKSTLLRAISRARPKVASYPFTTLNPHVGIVHYEDYVQLAVADLPGLIPDAHKNRGLGISFLKHIERCVCILYVIDLSAANPSEQLSCLQYELEQYREGLSKRPCALVANKMDEPSAKENLETLKQAVDIPIYPISAKYGTNIRVLLNFIRELYDKHNEGGLVW